MTQYRGVCREIFKPIKPIEDHLQLIQNPILDNTKLQMDNLNNTVIQKTQLHFWYNKNTKCLENINAVAEFSELPSIDNNKKKLENNVEIIIKIKKIKSQK